jgi:DNA-binding MarR family transcriptional regulator/GNAT superfamily N-acetyltransferase
VIFELAQQDAVEVTLLRRELDIDAGYLSRILRRFSSDGLVERERSAQDGRRQSIRLTPAGRAAYEDLDGRSATDIRAMLERLSEEQRQRLLGAMGTVREVLGDAPRPRAYLIRQPEPGELGLLVSRNAVLYAQEYGWDHTYEALVSKIVAQYVSDRDPEHESCWIAELDGAPVGWVLCTRRDAQTAQLRLLLVEPYARGLGIGSRLVRECMSFARQAGYRKMMLWTNDVLVEARRIYQRAGFQLVEKERHHSFGHDLVGETWWCDL